MRSRKLFEYLAQTARILLLIVALCSLAVASAWVLEPSLINRFDQSLKGRYADPPRQQFEKAKASFAQRDHETGMRTLHGLLVDLQDVQKQERLDPLKRKTLALFVQESLRQKSEEDVLRGYDELIEFDGRDISARFKRAKLLLETPERVAEGEKEIKELFRLTPTAVGVADERLKVALREGDVTTTVAALVASDSSYQSSLRQIFSGKRKWQIYWSTDGPFSAASSQKVSARKGPEQQLLVDFKLPKSAQKLRSFRIDLPPFVDISLADWSLSLQLASETRLFNSDNSRPKLRWMTMTPTGTLTSEGSADPYFFFSLSNQIDLTSEIRGTFEATPRPVLPTELRVALTKPLLLEEAIKELSRLGRHQTLRSLESALESAPQTIPQL